MCSTEGCLEAAYVNKGAYPAAMYANGGCKNHPAPKTAPVTPEGLTLDEARLALIEAQEQYMAGRAYWQAVSEASEAEVLIRGTRHDARHGGSPRPVGDHYFNDRGAYYAAAEAVGDAAEIFRRLNKAERIRVEAARLAAGLPPRRRKMDLQRLLDRDGALCHLCGLEMTERTDMHIDHVVPYSRLGIDDYINAALAHAYCNLVKHDTYAGSRDHSRLDVALAAFREAHGRDYEYTIRYL
jgi:5-methylcytosine-specific restriction endonuclease McrA